jgi:lipopolysaccharide/colanic/teichoic acid biosynthesis glycosyltransferase
MSSARGGGRPGHGAIDGLPPIARAEANGIYFSWGKRALDLLSTSIAVVLLLPVWLAVAVAIRLDTPGPILYRSWRVGEGGRLFHFLKFRSMVVGADAIRDDLRHLNEVDGPVFKIARDPRITKVGMILRRTSLDELPQLWNVLRGDMSLVGPRPPIPDEVRHYEPWQLRRLSVRPGLTCLWQISGRSSIGFDEWMRLDMEYIEDRSFTLDLKILFLTIPAVVSGKGAY